MPDSVCKLVSLTRARQQRDLKEGADRGLWYDEAAADHAVQVISSFRHSKDPFAGKRFILEPWQEHDIVRPLFGWKRADGSRRYRIAYIEMPRKNGKSTLAAAIGNYLFLADGVAGAEVYTAATKRDQARIVHSEAMRMISAMQEEDPGFRGHVRSYYNNMCVKSTNSKYEPLSADSGTLDGLNPSGVIIDEFHAHKNRDLWDKLRTAKGARRQPLIFIITTAGFDRSSVCWEVHQQAVQVLEQVRNDDRLFVYITTLDEGDDWQEESTWRKANPNLGVSVSLDDLREECAAAEISSGLENSFRRFQLNQWTTLDARWLDLDKWDACGEPFDVEDLRGRPCYAGLDLATISDLTALVLAFPIDDNVLLVPYFWCPRDAVTVRSKRDLLGYQQWVDDGYIRATPGAETDYDRVRRDIRELGDQFAIQEIAIDRLFQGAQLSHQLADDGFEVVAFGQGFYSMASPTLQFELLVNTGRIRHNGHPVLRWMAANVAVEQDAAGNLKPSKKLSADKIDGIVGSIMALGRLNVADTAGSVYETRGVLTLHGD